MSSSGNHQELAANGTTVYTKFKGPVRLSLSGGFGGGTAQVKIKNKRDVAIDLTDGVFTQAVEHLFDFPEDSVNELAIDLTGSTTPTLAVWFQGKYAQ